MPSRASGWFWEHGQIATSPIFESGELDGLVNVCTFTTHIGFVRIAVTVLTKYRSKARQEKEYTEGLVRSLDSRTALELVGCSCKSP